MRAPPASPFAMALAGEDGYPRRGELDFLDNRLDPSTGTIRGRAIFRNTDRRSHPGPVRPPASARDEQRTPAC